MTGTTVAARFRVLVAIVLALSCATGCAPRAGRPEAEAPVEVEASRTVEATGPSETAAASGAASPGAAGHGDGAVPVDAADARDLVRDEIPGYRPGALVSEAFTLSREYVPADTSTHDRLTVIVRRYRDPGVASQAVAALGGRAGVTASAATEVIGLRGRRFSHRGERVLVLADTQTVLELRARPAGGAGTGLDDVLSGIAEMLFD